MLMASAPLSGVSEITDTEEVTGSNPVSPTSVRPSQRHFLGGPRPGVRLTCDRRPATPACRSWAAPPHDGVVVMALRTAAYRRRW
jgi:hypothetical protein